LNKNDILTFKSSYNEKNPTTTNKKRPKLCLGSSIVIVQIVLSFFLTHVDSYNFVNFGDRALKFSG
jgi:hypothetical protein